jgi:photosystem II stability/assembly factor-like uncharacterized protein
MLAVLFGLALALFPLAANPAAGSRGPWQQLGPFGGSATAIAVDPRDSNTVVAGARNSLIYKSSDAGATWTLLPFPRHFRGSVQALVIDPADSRRYLAGVHLTGSPDAGLYESRDAGETWTHLAALEGISVEALAFHPAEPRRIVAGTRRGVFLSTDGGGGWRRISPAEDPELQAITAVAFDPAAPETIYAGTTHLPWKTTDGGRTWNSIRNGMLDDSDVFSISIDPRRPERLFASACSGIYRSENGGASWRKFLGIPGTQRRTHIIRQDPARPEVIFAGTTVGLLRSLDNGATWERRNQLNINSLAFDPANPRVIYLATENSGIWKSTDAGETFAALNTGFVNRRVGAVTAAGRRLYLNTVQEGAFGGVFASTDQGRTWKLAAAGERAGEQLLVVSASPLQDNLLFAAGETRVYRSSNAGATWLPVVLPAAAARPRALRVLSAGKTTVVLVGTDRGLFRSADAGRTWLEIRRVKTTALQVQALYGAEGSTRVALRTPAALLLSEDAGVNWSEIPPPPAAVYDLAIPANGAATLLAATAEGLYRTTDLGRSWNFIAEGVAAGTVRTVRFHPARPAEAFAVQYGRLYRSADAGSTWQLAAAETVSIRDLWLAAETPDRLLAITDDTGLFSLDLVGLQ